ncbi:MAG: glycosyltransferase family 2 protein, partial [Actinomycetota bacterium]|nr:glycosyltransferase family 2 protein [Actinomycetota bacterium]
MNLGVARMLARGVESILLLTADCVVAPTTLAALEDRLSAAPRVGAVGPLLAHSSARGRVFSAGGRIDRGTWDPGHHRQPGEVDDWDGAGPLACEWLDGACVLVRARALRETGPFDEAYFHYFDDVDLHLRMRSRGWDVECVPAALAWQEPGEIRPALWTRNRLRFLARHAPRRVLVRELGRQARNAGRDLRARDHQRAAERARGVALFLTRRWGPLGRGRTPATPRAPY